MSYVETLHRQHLERQLRFAHAALKRREKPQQVFVVVKERPKQPDEAPAPTPVDVQQIPITDAPDTPLRMDTIRRLVAQHYGVRKHDLLSDRRTADLVVPRHVVFYLGRRLTTLSLPMIGRHMGNRDHTTVLHGVRKIARDLQIDERLRASVEMLTEQLGGDPG